MKNRWRAAATGVGLATLLWSTGSAQAFCTTSLADPSADCKAALACQGAISTAAYVYVGGVQKQHATFLNTGQKGTLKVPPQHCVGGPNAGQACITHNGVCKVNPKGKICSADAD